MPNPLRSDPGRHLLTSIGEIFKTKEIVEVHKKPLLFVCGGATSGPGTSLRREFLVWASVELSDFVFLLAEDAMHDSFANEGRFFVNLSKFESLIADISDGILIFPESEGSYAELGYFSHAQIKEKTFVANRIRYQTSASFLNHGPIYTIEATSYLKQVRLTTTAEGITDFTPVRDRLRQEVKRPEYARRIHYDKFSKLNFRDRLFLTFGLLQLLQLANLDTIRYAISKCFPPSNPSQKDVTHLLRILLAAKWIGRRDEYFYPIRDVQLIEIKHIERERIIASMRLHFKKHAPHIFETLTDLAI
jgi:hypothetical protein